MVHTNRSLQLKCLFIIYCFLLLSTYSCGILLCGILLEDRERVSVREKKACVRERKSVGFGGRTPIYSRPVYLPSNVVSSEPFVSSLRDDGYSAIPVVLTRDPY